VTSGGCKWAVGVASDLRMLWGASRGHGWPQTVMGGHVGLQLTSEGCWWPQGLWKVLGGRGWPQWVAGGLRGHGWPPGVAGDLGGIMVGLRVRE
jgi:hypothetical protein